MRAWIVPLSYLDDQRLLGQHREIHAMMGSLHSPKRGYQQHPAVREFRGVHEGCLAAFHDVSVIEIGKRGWIGHRTPIDSEAISLCGGWYEHVETQTDLAQWERDLHDLIERWHREGKVPRTPAAGEAAAVHAVGCTRECLVRCEEIVTLERFQAVERRLSIA